MESGKQMDTVIEQCRLGKILYSEGVREFKKRWVSQALIDHAFNQCHAARELGMHRNTLSRTIRELEIDISDLRLKKKPIQSIELSQQVAARQA